MDRIYQNYSCFLLLFFSGLITMPVLSQTIISTENNGEYTGANNINGNSCVTFVIQNTNSAPVFLKEVDLFWKATSNGTVPKLWYSASSLGGAVSVTAPDWSEIATGAALNIPADGYYPTLTGLSFAIPAFTEYRFAVQSSNGISYSGSSAAIPSVNSFTANGVVLKAGNATAGSGNAVGYAGTFPNPAFTPRFFTGGVVICNGITPATTASTNADTILCSGSSATVRVTGGNLNNATEWRWYTGNCGGTFVGTGQSLAITNPPASATYYVRGEGGCASAPGRCASVAVTVRPSPGNPVIDAVEPICQGALVHLVINPVALLTIPDSITINSDPLFLAVPDFTANGVNTSLTVPALPSGSQITGIDVTLNMLHTYPGDMIFNLRAPNGKIANLYKYNVGTFTGGSRNMPNAGWFNAVTSSAGTVAYNSIDSPYRYNAGVPFKPDLYNDPVATQNPIPQNPAGFASNAASMVELYSTASGTWTLAMADGQAGDLGILTGWAIKIRYNRLQQTAATAGVWIPGADLFVDPAGNIPYDGDAARLDVYAKPLATTTYTATSVINGCYSAAASVKVIVDTPITVGDISLPADKVLCETGTVSFTAKASKPGASWQWQTDNGTGTTFTDISDNNNYEGAATDSLTVKTPPFLWNGYKYRCLLTGGAPCFSSENTREAVLTVNPAPIVRLSAGNAATGLIPGMTAQLSVTSIPPASLYSWFKNGTAFNGVTGARFNAIIDDLGVYTVSVVDMNGCTGTSNAVEISDSVSTKLFIYPNPAPNGKFSVSYYSIKGNQLPRMLTIYDSKGALVLKRIYNIVRPYDKMEVDFSGLGSGVYFVNLLDRSSKRIATGKVVVR